MEPCPGRFIFGIHSTHCWGAKQARHNTNLLTASTLQVKRELKEGINEIIHDIISSAVIQHNNIKRRKTGFSFQPQVKSIIFISSHHHHPSRLCPSTAGCSPPSMSSRFPSILASKISISHTSTFCLTFKS